MYTHTVQRDVQRDDWIVRAAEAILISMALIFDYISIIQIIHYGSSTDHIMPILQRLTLSKLQAKIQWRHFYWTKCGVNFHGVKKHLTYFQQLSVSPTVLLTATISNCDNKYCNQAPPFTAKYCKLQQRTNIKDFDCNAKYRQRTFSKLAYYSKRRRMSYM